MGDSTPRSHTILLVQMSKHESTRSYSDYPGQAEAMEGLLAIFETRLREQSPGTKIASYDLQHLLSFLDELKDLKALTWDSEVKAYKAYDRGWIKAKLQAHLLNTGK